MSGLTYPTSVELADDPPAVAGLDAGSRANTGMAATTSIGRLTAEFEYLGPARPAEARWFGSFADSW